MMLFENAVLLSRFLRLSVLFSLGYVKQITLCIHTQQCRNGELKNHWVVSIKKENRKKFSDSDMLDRGLLKYIVLRGPVEADCHNLMLCLESFR